VNAVAGSTKYGEQAVDVLAGPTAPSAADADETARPESAAEIRRLAALAACGGLLISAAFLDFSLYPLAWVAYVPILYAFLQTRSRRAALWVGFAAGMATNVPAFHWLVYTIHVFGGFPQPIAIFFYLCLSTYSAAQLVLFALLLRRTGAGPLGLAAPVIWVALEFLYPNLFPWRIANSQFHLPVLLQVGDLSGPFGLSFAILWCNAGILLALRRPRRLAPLLGAAALSGAIVAYGWWRMPVIAAQMAAAPVVRAGLVQGNVGIRQKGDVALFDVNLEHYAQLSEAMLPDVDVFIWPESVAQWWVPTDAQVIPRKVHPWPHLPRYLIYGGLAYEYANPRTPLKYNSAFLIDPQSRVLGRYDKQLLLPFGEYLPGASLIPSLAEISPQTGDFTPGRHLTTLDVPGLIRFGPLICYEDVPARIARGMTRAGAEALLTMFNDAWFGPTMAPYQHEALALWRAVENRRYFVRVGNAGATDVIDPLGRIRGRLGLFTAETLRADIHPMHTLTFYTRYGDVFGWSVVLAAILLLALGRRFDRPALDSARRS
jgi:apolipoprotein N-acyltransferase